MYLIPTAEVPVSNIFRNKILKSEDLPIEFVVIRRVSEVKQEVMEKTPKGIIRQHQFDKVELVKFVHPEDSEQELEKLTDDAESILIDLKLPYRKVVLCSNDTGFSSCKTYDLEVWFPSQKNIEKYLHVPILETFKAGG